MKKLIFFTLVALAIFNAGRSYENRSASPKTDVADPKEKMGSLFKETQNGIATCLSSCKELISDIMS